MKWELQPLHKKPLKDLQKSKSFHTVSLTLSAYSPDGGKNRWGGHQTLAAVHELVKAFISFPNSQECVFDGEYEVLFTSGRITHVQTSNLARLNKHWNYFPSQLYFFDHKLFVCFDHRVFIIMKKHP